MNKKIHQMEAKIESIKKKLGTIGPMRPGTISKHARKKGKKGEEYGQYWQISYTYQMKGKTEYLSKDLVKDIEAEVIEYKKFKKLTQEWIDLALNLSRLKIKKSKNSY
jgi:hypothetical protein